jgi:hypothetical protein
MLVQADGNSDVLGSHLLLGKGLDLSDGPRSSLFEGARIISIKRVCSVQTYDRASCGG